MGEFEIESNELKINITHVSTGDQLHYERETNTVYTYGGCDYGVFVKMVKLLKRTKSKESFSAEFLDD